MKKSEPKMFLNIQIDNAEFEEKVKGAMDNYVENIILKNLEDKIQRLIEIRVERLIGGTIWCSDGQINGKSFTDFVRDKSEKAIEEIIEGNIKDILAKKIAEMLKLY